VNAKVYIGSLLTDGSANFLSFKQVGNEFRIATQTDYDSASSVSDSLVTLSVPTGKVFSPRLSMRVQGNSSDGNDTIQLASGDFTSDKHIIGETIDQGTGGSDAMVNSVTECWTNTSAQVSLTTNAEIAMCRIYTTGWLSPYI
jgi:hypothetical protein